MKLPSLSEIGKGPLFENKDVMGMGEGPPSDENWVAAKEADIVFKFKRGEDGLVNKNSDLKMKMMNGRDKLLAGETDAKTRLFGKQSFDMNFNQMKTRGGNMYNKNYSKKVEDIMGKSKKASKGNYENKVSMVMGNQGGGFNMGAFDNKAKNYLSMGGGGGMKNPMQKSKMLSASGGAPKHMNEYFGGAQKPIGKVNINALMGGAKAKGMPNMGIPGNGGINIQSLIGGAKKQSIPNKRPEGNGTRKMIMGAKDSMGTQSKINNMLGQNMTGAKNVGASAFMGVSQKPEGMAWNRVNVQGKLDLWGDADGDKVANILDCQPTNPMAQGWLHDAGSAIAGGAKRVGGAIARSPRAAYNVAKYGEAHGGFEIMEGTQKTRKEKSQEGAFKADILAAEREKQLSGVRYGKDITPQEAQVLSLERERVGMESASKGKIAAAKAQGELTKVGLTVDAQRAKSQIAFEKARSGGIKQPGLPTTTIEGTGKKRKIIMTGGGQQGFGSPFGGEVGGSSMGFGYTGLGGGIGSGSPSPFGSGAGLSQMSGITHTGAGLQMADLHSTGAGLQMAALPTGGQGMGFEQMANIKTGSGSGFHQMLGVEPPIQEMPEQVAQPSMESESPQIQESSEESIIKDGVEYIRLPSGKLKNTKTGKEVKYSRGKYND